MVNAVNYTNGVWIKKIIKGMKEEITKPMVIYYDNTNAINISKNHVMHIDIKHIAIKYHYLREFKTSKNGICKYKRTTC